MATINKTRLMAAPRRVLGLGLVGLGLVGLGLVGLGLWAWAWTLRRPPLFVYMVFVVDCLVAGSEEV